MVRNQFLVIFCSLFLIVGCGDSVISSLLEDGDGNSEVDDNDGGDSTPAYCSGVRLTDSPFANSSESVDGSDEANAFTICTAQQLNEIGTDSAHWDKSFKLKANIDMASFTSNTFNIIGNTGTHFTGNFYGDGFIISNLSYDDASSDTVSLFGMATGGIISDLGIENVNFRGKTSVGAIAGYCACFIYRSYSTGTIEGNEWNAGGLVGILKGGEIHNSFSVANVTGGTLYTGGLVGRLWWVNGSDTGIFSSFAAGNVVGTDEVGGLVGQGIVGKIENSFSVGNVTGNSSSDYVSPLLGRDLSSNLTNNFYDQNATCTNSFGGGSCTVVGQGESAVDYFFLVGNAPMDTWDFATKWLGVSNDLPVLR